MRNNMNSKLAALLPMKGHSERVPNKNLRDFNGKPLMYYTINTLTQVDLISDIYVDTDSGLIAEKVLEYFPMVKIIERPRELCGDMVSMNDIIGYDLSVTHADYYVQTHSTNPLLTPQTLKTGCQKFMDGLGTYDSLFSVTKLQTRLYDKAGHAVNHDPDNLIRTQDLEPLYQENSNFYIFSRTSFETKHTRIGEHAQLLEMDSLEAIDIDNESDFLLAEQLHKLRKETS